MRHAYGPATSLRSASAACAFCSAWVTSALASSLAHWPMLTGCRDRTTPRTSRQISAAGSRPAWTPSDSTWSPSRTVIFETSPGRPCTRSDMVRARSIVTQRGGDHVQGRAAGGLAHGRALAGHALAAGVHGLVCSLRAAPGLAGPGRDRCPAGSAPREGGLPRPILNETAHPRALILGREQAGEVQPLDLQAGAEVCVQAVVDGLLRGPEGQRRARRIARHQAVCGLVDLGVGDDLVDQADLAGFRRGHETPGVDDVLRPGRPDQPGQPL